MEDPSAGSHVPRPLGGVGKLKTKTRGLLGPGRGGGGGGGGARAGAGLEGRCGAPAEAGRAGSGMEPGL